MIIKKYTGKTKEEAIALAREELGESIVIMNTKDKKPDGVLGILKKSIWEVTVAVEDEQQMPAREKRLSTTTFSVAADEKINLDFPPVDLPERKKEYTPQPAPVKPISPASPQAISEEDLRSAFREISQVIENAEETNVSTARTNPSSPVIKKDSIKTPEKNATLAPVQAAVAPSKKKNENNLPIVRMVYNNLIDNEVDERYINEILDDMGNILSAANSLDYLISNIYQKMVLKLGKPVTIDASSKGPTVVFFVGPTGVGKTTTIAKIASEFKLEKQKKVAFITADTYRIAATEQLNVYANILGAPISIVMETSELPKAVESLKDQDLILIDTVGFSHKNQEQREGTRALLDALDPKYKKEVYLVLSVTTKYQDLKDIADTYSGFCDYNLIFTKLDETNHFGNILNLKLYTNAALSYITNGQMVPDDIEVLDSQKLVKGLLGG